tara:strand:- start:647 stop:859 length:213 start_codon:yes stop_codon:yes gene_type:complete
MAWVFKNSGDFYTGETHELMGRTFTGKTRTAASMPLLFTEDEPAKPEPKKPRHNAAKARAAKFTKDELNA